MTQVTDLQADLSVPNDPQGVVLVAALRTAVHSARFVAMLRNARSAGRRVWTIIAGLSVLSVGASIAVWDFDASPPNQGLAFVLLIVAFALVESFPVHVHYRSESTSFSLLEIPILFGLFYADAPILIAAIAGGAFFALTITRGQPLVKLVFNVANLVLQSASTLLLFELMVDRTTQDIGPTIAAAALFAVVTGSVLSVTAIAFVTWAAQGFLEYVKYRNMVGFGFIVGLANASVSLVAVELAEDESWFLALLLVIPLAALFGSYQAFIDERTQREQVEFLYSATKSLQTLDERQDGVETLVAEAAMMFRSLRVDLVLLPPGESSDRAMRYTTDHLGAATSTHLLRTPMAVLEAIEAISDSAVIAARHPSSPGWSHLQELGLTHAMVAVLHGEHNPIGLLTIGERGSTVSDFSAEDLRLFETLAYHAATALENDRLGQALAQLRALEQELSHLATHDALTGLPNRLRLRQHLDHLINEGRDDVELLFIDLDDFKLVNDTFGHASGDHLLRQVGRRIRSTLRSSDVVARLGGDEFAVVTQTHGDGAFLADRIIDALSEPIRLRGSSINVRCSIGLATTATAQSTSHLLRQADVAMYAAKNGGKGRFAYYSPELGDELSAQQQLQQQLRDAMDANEFCVHYQPIYDLAKNRIVGAEALVRWDDGNGVRPAETFLSAAEESGLVTQIDRWVFTQVLDDLRMIEIDGADEVWSAVNLSARHLQEDDVVDFVLTSVRNAGIDPSRLVLEITETAAIRDIEANIAKLNRLASVGFTIALDDFGTGFSSINHLRRFPVDLVKIAQPFVADLEAGSGESFVRAMVDLAHTLGLPVVGEGVERIEQLQALNTLGCDMAQGFLLAEPVPIDELRAQLVEQSIDSFSQWARLELGMG